MSGYGMTAREEPDDFTRVRRNLRVGGREALSRIEAENERLRQERDDLIRRIGEAIQRNDAQQDAPWLADVLWPQNPSTEQEEG